MSPLRMFASIRERRRRSGPPSNEEGARIKRRLQELLAVPTPTQAAEVPPPTLGLRTTQHAHEARSGGELISDPPSALRKTPENRLLLHPHSQTKVMGK
jgi:hypothetical protein